MRKVIVEYMDGDRKEFSGDIINTRQKDGVYIITRRYGSDKKIPMDNVKNITEV